MRSRRALLTAGGAGLLVLLSAISSSANTCVALPGLKHVRHVCGIVINQLDEPIPNARLTLLKGGAELVTIETGADGRFAFGAVEAGDYELRAERIGYLAVRSAIKIARPTAKCTRGLRVVLPVTSCGGGIYRLKR